MKLPAEAELLRVFIGESDKFEGRPLYEMIDEGLVTVERAGVIFYRHNESAGP